MNPNNYPIKTALISVSDKTGIVDFSRKLTKLGIVIFSTGGTEKLLLENNIPAKSVFELTNFPEIMNGRLKTLHPAVHAGLLADLENLEHQKSLETHKINSIDLLVVNLYPFETVLQSESMKNNLVDNKKQEINPILIENIDIGGPSMLRSAAKNYRWTVAVSNPKYYQNVLDFLEKNGTISEDFRLQLAGEAFNHTAHYDTIISGYFNKINNIEFPEILNITYQKTQDCRYGENPHQTAAVYGNFAINFKKIHGKELSYNNIIDINSTCELMLEFCCCDKSKESNSNNPNSDNINLNNPNSDNICNSTVAIVKHTNPCGVASADNFVDAFKLAYQIDKESPFGGIIALNGFVDKAFAEEVHSFFSEVIIANGFSEDALNILTKKKDRRLIVVDFEKIRKTIDYNFRSIPAGMLYQKADKELYKLNNINDLQVVSKRKPTKEELDSLDFAWKVAKHVKSNAIVYAKNNRTLGIGAGQMSRIDASRIAIEKAKHSNLDLQNSVVASDAFFPFPDSLLAAVNSGASAVIQPGGSVRDDEVIAEADKHKIAMIFTGMRHFKH